LIRVHFSVDGSWFRFFVARVDRRCAPTQFVASLRDPVTTLDPRAFGEKRLLGSPCEQIRTQAPASARFPTIRDAEQRMLAAFEVPNGAPSSNPGYCRTANARNCWVTAASPGHVFSIVGVHRTVTIDAMPNQ
jgi:hypothetical protein